LGFVTALRFLTIIPLLRRREISPEEVGRSIVYFPLVGVIIGLILFFLSWLLGLLLPPALVNVLLVVSLVVLSGGLHLDGFVDTCDGIGGNKTVAERWQVMADSRVGAFGIIGVSSLLLVKYVALSNVPASWLVPTLLLMPVISRWAMVYAVFAYPYAKPSGLGKVFKQGASRPRFTIATVITLVLAVILAQLPGLLIMFATWVIVMAVAFYLKGKFGGLTGDTYGAINEVAEVLVLILVCLLAHAGWLGGNILFGG
jgi:adenosylcobinamide-GDP ribazoletransferase